MKRYTIHALSAAVLFLIMGIFFFPFLLLVPLTLLSIPAFALMKLFMPEFFERRGY